MRKVLYVVILALPFLAPLERADVATLLPIEAVAVYTEGNKIILETNTKNRGEGNNASEALENLKAVTPAVVYLDTARYLLVSEDALDCVETLRTHLKESVEVAVCNGKGKVAEMAKYVNVHADTVQLKEWRQ